jgi:hypothetical protein
MTEHAAAAPPPPRGGVSELPAALQDAKPHRCPLCRAAVTATTLDEPLVQYIASRRTAAPDAADEDVVDGPLPPQVRAAIYDSCRADAAAHAETFARRSLAHRRVAQLRELESSGAQTELEAAKGATSSQVGLATALSAELSAVDEQIRQLRLEQHMIQVQLRSVHEAKSTAVVREVECARRLGALQGRAAFHANEAARHEIVVAELVPGIVIDDMI